MKIDILMRNNIFIQEMNTTKFLERLNIEYTLIL